MSRRSRVTIPIHTGPRSRKAIHSILFIVRTRVVKNNSAVKDFLVRLRLPVPLDISGRGIQEIHHAIGSGAILCRARRLSKSRLRQYRRRKRVPVRMVTLWAPNALASVSDTTRDGILEPLETDAVLTGSVGFLAFPAARPSLYIRDISARVP